jgi:hypothetical protein
MLFSIHSLKIRGKPRGLAGAGVSDGHAPDSDVDWISKAQSDKQPRREAASA